MPRRTISESSGAYFSFTVMSVLFFCFHTKNSDVRRILVIFLISVIVVVLVLSNIFYKTDALRMIKVYFVHTLSTCCHRNQVIRKDEEDHTVRATST